MIVAGCGKQERLGFHAKRFCYPREQDVANRFSAGRAAGFAREHYVDAQRLEAI